MWFDLACLEVEPWEVGGDEWEAFDDKSEDLKGVLHGWKFVKIFGELTEIKEFGELLFNLSIMFTNYGNLGSCEVLVHISVFNLTKRILWGVVSFWK